MSRIGKYSSARFRRDGIVFLATSLIALSVAAWAAAEPAPASPASPSAANPAGAQPSAPTGGGPTGAKPAPAPPQEQTVILPSASGHVNSAAPTMHRSCEVASPSRQGTAAPDGSNDPCLREATPADKARAPEQSN